MCLGPPFVTKGQENLEKHEPEVDNLANVFDDDLDEFLANLNYEESVISQSKNSEDDGRHVSLDNIFCNSSLTNTTVNINVNLSKQFVTLLINNLINK